MTRARRLAYAQLVRLPNVFTAFADIGLGVLASGLDFEWAGITALLLFLASGCLYCGGMVWNDFFDVEQDRIERPFRPIPSGRVSRSTAGRIGGALLLAGLVFAALAFSFSTARSLLGWLPLALSAALLAAILAYDAWLKHTPAGPLGMGLCRFLNVLLGWTAAVAAGWPWSVGLHLAAVVGLYIVGVTWFARTEAQTSRKSRLAAAATVMASALILALAVPVSVADALGHQPASPLCIYLLVGQAFLVGIPLLRAIARPTPPLVQAAVKRSILGLIVLDAVLATALVGTMGLVLLVLLISAAYLGRWVYST